MIEEIKKEFLKNKDEKYADFSSSLLPGVKNVIGIRLPILRKLAKEIAKKNWEIFLIENDDEFMELTMLEGMIIGYIDIDIDKKFKLIKKFIPKITNWSICDSFCSTLKFITKNQEKTKTFIEPYFKSKNEYDLRFCFVILLMYFIDYDYDYVMNRIYKFNSVNYYAKMAVSWTLSICIVKNFNKCIIDINEHKIQDFVFKKGITKAIESFRLNKEQKEFLKKLRK